METEIAGTEIADALERIADVAERREHRDLAIAQAKVRKEVAGWAPGGHMPGWLDAHSARQGRESRRARGAPSGKSRHGGLTDARRPRRMPFQRTLTRARTDPPPPTGCLSGHPRRATRGLDPRGPSPSVPHVRLASSSRDAKRQRPCRLGPIPETCRAAKCAGRTWSSSSAGWWIPDRRHSAHHGHRDRWAHRIRW